jgi:uncharacterized protein (TIGR04551 family)
MLRLPFLAAALALAPLAAAQAPPPARPAEKKEAAPPDDVQAAIKREVEKAKAEIRDEVRAEIQGQQSAKEFLEAAGPSDKPKLDLLTLGGYYRLRGDLFDNFALRRSADPGGYTLFPTPPNNPNKATQTTADMRLRLEPVLNVSEQVRVLSQIDLLDGTVLGSGQTGYAVPAVDSKVTLDRPEVRVKRAWGEVQTPLGLLSFGRMPSQWGLGILAHAGAGLDDDRGDSVDRLQLAVPWRQSPLGPLVVVPYYDIESSGLISENLAGSGQPISLSKADERWALGLKAVRIDTDEELQRKMASGASSWNYGAFYGYHAQHYSLAPTAAAPLPGSPQVVPVTTVPVGLSYQTLDLWARWRTKRARLEVEVAGVYGTIADDRLKLTDPAQGPVKLRQLGGAAQFDYRPSDGKLLLGVEYGMASGDRTPGMGNHPERGLPQNGSIDGSQIGTAIPSGGALHDDFIRNFRFNPAYRVDLILWRDLLGSVTDAWYLKPTLRYDVLEGLSLRAALVYSQAMYASSTPSTKHRPLGLELDTGIHYASDDGFNAWLAWGFLHPLDGLDYMQGTRTAADHALVSAHAIRTGLAIRF